MRILKTRLLWFLPSISSVLIWALPNNGPRTDEPGNSRSGNSFDDNISIIFRALKTHPIQGDFMIRVHKGSTTQGFCQYLSSEYPTKNVLIYHNQSSIFNGVNNVHISIQFPQFASSGNDVYEIEVFDSGTFKLVGESGYHNWAFCGSNWVQDGSSVVFHPHQAEESPVDSPQLKWLQNLSPTVSPAKLGGGYIAASQEGTDNSAEIPSSSSGSSGSWTIEETGNNGAETQFTALYNDADLDAELRDLELIIGKADEVADAVIESGEAIAAEGPGGVVVAVAVIAAACLVSVALIYAADFIALFQQHKPEREYTQITAYTQGSAIPSQNQIVFHNQDTTLILAGWEHYHYELPLGAFHKTQGYEIYSFDFGTVTLAGDGGYENWAFVGNWYREPNSAYVQFFPRNIAQRSLLKRARSETGKPVKRRAPRPPQVPLRSDPEDKHGYYFVDCFKPDSTLVLGIAYYSEILPLGGNVAQEPEDFAEVLSNHAGKQVWQGEGDTTFANGTLFHWSFIHHGWDSEEQVSAGIAETPFEQFWVYREAGGFLYNTAANWTCNALYSVF